MHYGSWARSNHPSQLMLIHWNSICRTHQGILYHPCLLDQTHRGTPWVLPSQFSCPQLHQGWTWHHTCLGYHQYQHILLYLNQGYRKPKEQAVHDECSIHHEDHLRIHHRWWFHLHLHRRTWTILGSLLVWSWAGIPSCTFGIHSIREFQIHHHQQCGICEQDQQYR